MPVLTKINTNVIADNAVTSAKIPADAIIASDIAAGAVGISELATVTGVTAEYHKVPTFANDAARNTAIPSPANGMLVYNTDSGAVQQYNGIWSTIAPAPNVTALSGFLNEDTDSTITVFGSNFTTSSGVKMFDAAAGGAQIGSGATTTFVSNALLKAVFGGGSIGAAGSSAYIEVDNAGTTNRFATAITVNADPTVLLSGTSGTSANTTTHLGTYGGSSTGGGGDSNTKLLLNFDRSDGSTDFEDNSNTDTGGDGHKVIAGGNAHIETDQYKFGTAHGKTNNSSAYFDGATDYVTINNSPILGSGNFTVEFWINVSATQNAGESTYYIWDGRGDTNSANALTITMNTSDQLQVYNYTSVAAIIPYHSDTAVTAGTWAHIAVVRSGTNVIKLYIDGVLKGTSPNSDQGSINKDSNSKLGVPWGAADQEFTGYIDSFRISDTARWTSNFTPEGTIYGATLTQTIPTITLTGAATQLAADEDIEFTSVVNPTKPANNQRLTDSGIGLVLTNLADANKNKATLTGTIASAASTTHTNMAVKAQVRKSLGNAAYNNSTTVTFSSSTTTIGLAPGMPLTGTGISVAGPLVCGLTNSSTTVTAVSTTGLVVGMQVNAFTGIPAGATIASISTNVNFVISSAATATDADAVLTFNTIIASVDSATVITLSNTTTSGAQTGNTLIFEDLTRVTHVNGPDVLDGTQAMMTIATAAAAAAVHFNGRRYMGTRAIKKITGLGFQPDFVWIKTRSAASNHVCQDSVRGATKVLVPSTNVAENAYGQTSDTVTSFDTDGFTLGDDTTGYGVNNDDVTTVAWGWKAGGAPTGAGKTMTDGTETTISSSATFDIGADMYDTDHFATNGVKRSVNTVGKFSITEITNPSSAIANRAVPHGLGGIPDFVLIKPLDTAGWLAYHTSLTSNTTLINKLVNLHSGGAESALPGSAAAATNYHVSTPDNAGWDVNEANISVIFYAWKAVSGISAFGVYTGTGGNNAMNTEASALGFRPRFLMIKGITGSGSESWKIMDAFRNGSSSTAWYKNLIADGNDAEDTNSGAYTITINATGFQFDSGNVNTGSLNTSGEKYIYCAFA